MTEEQQDGTAPAPEAIASSEAPASEETVAAIAVADEPVATETPEPTTEAGPRDGSAVDEAPAEARRTRGPAVAEETRRPRGARRQPAPEAVAEPVVEEAPVAAIEDEAADAPPAADIEEEDEAPAPPPKRTGPEPTTMEELLAEQDSDIKSFKHGDVVEGTVVRIDKDEILVDIGAKSEGVVSNRELYGRNAESQPQLAIGDTVLVYVLQPESPEGHVVLSLRRAGLERKWRSMQELFEAGDDHRRPGHRPQQGRPDRRLRDPRLRADQPDRGLPAPAAERAAA